MAIAEAWFCAQFVLLSGRKIQTWPIVRFLTVIHLLIFLSVGNVHLQHKYRPTT